MQFELNETQIDIKKAAREFAEKEFDVDLALNLEKEGRFPDTIHEKACRLGFIGIDYPEEYGGQNFGLFENVLVTEEFTKKDSTLGIAISLSDMASCIIIRHGSEEQKRGVLTKLIEERSISTVSILNNEDDNLISPSLTGGGYEIIKGKSWAINASISEFMVIIFGRPYAKGALSLLVKKDWEGVNISTHKPLMGLKVFKAHEITFNNVHVPKDYVIHFEDEDENPLRTFRNFILIKTSAQALGIAQAAFDRAIKHAREREQFGRKIIQFQAIQFMFADIFTIIEAARGLVYQAARAYDANDKGLDKIASVAKLFSTDVAVRTAIDSIQIHGGVGLMKDYSIERMLRDAKTIQNLFDSNLSVKARIGRSFI